MEKGLDINHKDRGGSFALSIASREGHTKLFELLLKSRRAKVNQQDNDGISSLMYASSGGYMLITRLLLRYQAKVDLQDKKGWSALMFAVAGEYTDLVVYLLGEGAQVNLQDVCGTSPLMLSCFTGHVRVTKVLLAHDADVNLQNNEGITALMMSSYNGHTEIVELLVKYRADIDAVTSIGKSALDFSNDRGHDEVSKLLTEYGARKRGKFILKRTMSMRDHRESIEALPILLAGNSELGERLDRMEQNQTAYSARVEQILQALLTSPTTSSVVTSPAAKSIQPDAIPTLQAAFKLLAPMASDWHNIGVMLNLENHSLKEIECNYRMVRDCLREMLSQWLNRAIPPPTWEELAEALEDADHQGTARKIRRV